MLYNLYFFSSKCRLFHNATLFGFCITHILNTECAKIRKKKICRHKFKGFKNAILYTNAAVRRENQVPDNQTKCL